MGISLLLSQATGELAALEGGLEREMSGARVLFQEEAVGRDPQAAAEAEIPLEMQALDLDRLIISASLDMALVERAAQVRTALQLVAMVETDLEEAELAAGSTRLSAAHFQAAVGPEAASLYLSITG
jgi:hypothetical protein